MGTHTHRRLRLLVCAALLWSGAAAAQSEFASFFGTVKDEQGQPIAGVKFQLKDSARGRVVTFATNTKGVFSRRTILPGGYELVVEKDPYQPIHSTLTFKAGEEKRLEFTLALAVTPAESAFQQGVAAFNAGDLATAARHFEEAARLAPELPEIRTNLGLVYLRLGRTDEGIAMLERASQLAPQSPQAKFQLAAAYIEARRTDDAIDLIRKGLGEQPDLTDASMLDAVITLGSLYFSKGDIETAAATFDRALAARPGSPSALLGLGKCAVRKGGVEQALRYFDQVVASAPGTPEAAEAEAFIKELKKKSAPARD